MRTILITGANGFIGKNLQLHLTERKDVQVLCFTIVTASEARQSMNPRKPWIAALRSQ